MAVQKDLFKLCSVQQTYTLQTQNHLKASIIVIFLQKFSLLHRKLSSPLKASQKAATLSACPKLFLTVFADN